ncbi:hypothetical protein AB4Z10_22115 [Bosea sp. RAF48]|jgi:succinate dehydrogenase/fumarate reductase flavoprotein subunit|uniref:hypothetical protein n=1 Tax=Bosea sp. RAF48 TaxID=3237480 RepID=UPI003F8FA403
MFNFLDGCLDWAEALVEGRLARRRLARREAAALIKRAGSSAFEAAQQIALLARQRGDKQATELWLEVAREITRRDASKRG